MYCAQEYEFGKFECHMQDSFQLLLLDLIMSEFRFVVTLAEGSRKCFQGGTPGTLKRFEAEYRGESSKIESQLCKNQFGATTQVRLRNVVGEKCGGG